MHPTNLSLKWVSTISSISAHAVLILERGTILPSVFFLKNVLRNSAGTFPNSPFWRIHRLTAFNFFRDINSAATATFACLWLTLFLWRLFFKWLFQQNIHCSQPYNLRYKELLFYYTYLILCISLKAVVKSVP